MNPELAGQASPDEIRRHLSPLYLLGPADGQSGNRWHYRSPFRKDDNPSLDIWLNERGEWRIGDFTEGGSYSVIDLVARLHPDDEPVAKARDLLVQQVTSGYTPPVTAAPSPKQLPDDTASRLEAGRESAFRTAAAALGGMVDERPGLLPVPPAFLVDEWRVSADNGNLLIPNYDGDTLMSVKVRKPDGAKKNLPGSTLRLYGLWRLRPDRPVLLVEGESDAWAASFSLPEYDVLAIPGAGTKPERAGADQLADRHITICFDADDAGRNAATTWSSYLLDQGCVVSVVSLPTGADIASLPATYITSLPERSRPVQPPPSDITVFGGVYVRLNGQGGGGKPLSNWYLRVDRMLRAVDGGIAFEGTVLPHNRKTVLPVESLASTQTLTRWCNQFGGVWMGGAGDHQRLMQLLLSQSVWVPEGRMTRQVGYHDGDFVWPDGHIGTDDWTYVPPASKINLSGRIEIRPAPVDPVECVKAMLAAGELAVTAPILAWMAVAPIRPLFDRFPILSISGASGSGKTTLTEKLLRSFSGSDITTNLTSTTPYAVTAFFSAANAVPVWFDEYRPGAREDAKNQLDQLLRDCYTGQPSYKGGMTDNKAEVTEIPTVVPVVVTGEDSFQETSHTDRMILVRLTKKAQGNLGALDEVDCTGFAHAYLTWLLTGEPPVVALHKKQYPGLNERQSLNLEVLKYGWHLLQAFLSDWDPTYKLPRIDLASVISEAQEAAATNPLIEAVRWAMETPTFLDVVWHDAEYLYIHPINLISEARKTGAFVLPTSNAKGVRALLRDQHNGEDVRLRKEGKHIRVIRIPISEVLDS